MRYRRYPETVDKADRTAVAGLRRAIPTVPAGWKNRPRHIRRLNGLEAPGVFSATYVSEDGLRLAFVALPPTGRVQYSIGRAGGEPTEEDVGRVSREWFPDTVVEAHAPLDGIVFLRLHHDL